MHRQLTNRVMNLMLEGDHYVLKTLREQFFSAQIESIEDTGVGMFVDFLVSGVDAVDNQKGVRKNFAFGDVHGEVEGSAGVGFVLFIKEGYISMLEGYSYEDDAWKKVTENIKLNYGENGRNIDVLSTSWKEKEPAG
jgi:hypothetical protein